MNTTTPSTSPLRQRMLNDMALRKLSPKTQKGYIRAVKRFAQWLDRSPDTATKEDLRRYQLHLVDIGTSSISINGAITALDEAAIAADVTIISLPSDVQEVRVHHGNYKGDYIHEFYRASSFQPPLPTDATGPHLARPTAKDH